MIEEYVGGCSSRRVYEVAGSRPPDGGLQVSSFPTLERLTSPTLLEQQRDSKKYKGDSEKLADHESMTMDDDQTIDPDVLVADMSQHTDGQQDGDKPTYASKVTTNGTAGNGVNRSIGICEDDGDVALNEEGQGFGGSKALESRQIEKNGAYRTSSPDKRSRPSKKATNSVEVVPTVEGRPINVVGHASRVGSGSHSAIRIVEDGISTAEGRVKGLKVKKSMETKVARSNVVEWVKSAQARINQEGALGSRGGDGSSGLVHGMDGLPNASTAFDIGQELNNYVMSNSEDRLGGDQ
ncbi:hypothetical protein V6N13_073080 [Hibiscus sabdariffa]